MHYLCTVIGTRNLVAQAVKYGQAMIGVYFEKIMHSDLFSTMLNVACYICWLLIRRLTLRNQSNCYRIVQLNAQT